MGKKFKETVTEKLLVEVYSRYSKGGFLIGDILTLKPDFKNDEGYQALTDVVKDHFEAYLADPTYSDKYLRVLTVKANGTSPSNTGPGDWEGCNDSLLDVSFEIAPGLVNGGPFCLPNSLFNHAKGYLDGACPPIPQSMRREDKGTGTPTPVEPVQSGTSPVSLRRNEEPNPKT